MSYKSELYEVTYLLQVLNDLVDELNDTLGTITYEPLQATLNSLIHGYGVSIITYECEHEKPCGLTMPDLVGGLLGHLQELVEVGDKLQLELMLEGGDSHADTEP